MAGPAGAFRNPVLELSGDAIDRGIVDILADDVHWLRGGKSVVISWLKGSGLEAKATVEESNGRRVIRTEMKGLSADQYNLPPGCDTLLAWPVCLTGVQDGEGEARISFLPASGETNRMQLNPVYRIKVDAPKWIPRGAGSESRNDAGTIRETLGAIRLLNTSSILSGVAIIEDHGHESFSQLPSLIERWLLTSESRTPHRLETTYEGHMKPLTGHVPKKRSRLALDEIGVSKKWNRLFAKPESLQSLFLQIVEDDTDQLWAGASIQRTIFLEDKPSPPGAIHVAFWRQNRPEDAGDRADNVARESLTGLLDAIFETMNGLQGWVAAWDWIPHFTMADEYYYTPYEEAFSLRHSNQPGSGWDPMRSDWCDRCLRAVSGQLWISVSLMARIDRKRLSSVAIVSPVGSSGFRVSLLPGEDLNRLEEILEPILPQFAEAQEASC
jgi:hypothetical protein